MKKSLLSFLLVLSGLVILSVSAHSQNAVSAPMVNAMDNATTTNNEDVITDETDDTATDDAADEDFAFGTVVKVNDTQITILEYDFDSEEEKQNTYTLNSETKYENVSSPKEILPNDEVELNFKEDNGTKIATMVYKDIVTEEDEGDVISNDNPADATAGNSTATTETQTNSVNP
jgi:hypothetical protein